MVPYLYAQVYLLGTVFESTDLREEYSETNLKFNKSITNLDYEEIQQR